MNLSYILFCGHFRVVSPISLPQGHTMLSFYIENGIVELLIRPSEVEAYMISQLLCQNTKHTTLFMFRHDW